MARFNTKASKLINISDDIKGVRSSTKTINLAGGEAYKPSDKLELTLRTMGFLMSGDAYYAKEKDTSTAISRLVRKISVYDPEFVLKLAVYARNVMHLRTVSMYLLVEYAKTGVRNPGAYNYVPKILKRADEPAEALSYYFQSSGSDKVPNMLKKGIAKTLNNFDEYQFGKYNRKGQVTLKDAVFISHPKPKDKAQQVLYDKIVNGTLDIPFTWETHISKNGASKKTWEEVIPEMGFMATLRNLKNFVKNNVDLTPVIAQLTNPEQVKKSQQFPYRFFSAYKELTKDKNGYWEATDEEELTVPTKLLDAVNDAMTISVENVPRISGKTFIASDNSGSMHSGKPSAKGAVTNIDVASLFSAISLHVCKEAQVGVFGQTYATVPISKRGSILDNMDKIKKTDVGHSTNAWTALAHLIDKNAIYDRIFLFSDMQCYNSYERDGKGRDLNSYITQYRKEINPNCRLYSFDVASYGLLKFPENDPLTCPIAGYSDSIFQFVPMFEDGRETMVKKIETFKI
jgi:hypothetical protein